MRSKAQISEEINTIREQLHKLIHFKDSLHHRKVTMLSQALDECILEYMASGADEENQDRDRSHRDQR